MATIEEERDQFWGGVFKDRAEKFLTENAGQHFDNTPELVRAFCPSPRPSAVEVAAAKERYVASFLRQVKSAPDCPASLK